MFSSHFENFIFLIYLYLSSIGGVLVIFKSDDKDASIVSGSVRKRLITNG